MICTLMHDANEWLDRHSKTKAALKGAVFGLTTTFVAFLAVIVFPRELSTTLIIPGIAGVVGLVQTIIPELTSKNKFNLWRAAGKSIAAFAAGVAMFYFVALVEAIAVLVYGRYGS